MTILLATNNRHKAQEMAAVLAWPGLQLMTLADLPASVPEPHEDGSTLEANAFIKAQETWAATGLPCIADDTGLEVAALNGAPGVYSARYAGPDCSYADNCNKLLAELKDAADRTARFRTVICYVDDCRTLFAEGLVEGLITDACRGEGGFGYDPVFQPVGRQQTFAQMTADQKNAVSHRGLALAALKRQMEKYLNDRDA